MIAIIDVNMYCVVAHSWQAVGSMTGTRINVGIQAVMPWYSMAP